MSIQLSRRISARRGSTAAPDPYAKHADLARESSSILTIVRVPTQPASPAIALETPPSPRRAHRRLGSNPSSQPGGQEPPPGRVSFAFSSFSKDPHGHQGATANTSSGGSPRLRPSSPHRAPSSPSPFAGTRLSPEQLFEVAKQATNPRLAAPSSPAPVSHSPVIPPHAASPQNASSHHHVQPATFMPLPADIYLPFLDRPAEVSALLATPPSAKLFALLAQTFPKRKEKRADEQLPVNTAEWTFEDLSYWLTKTTREEASDAFWVQTVRTCILLHSELIWERLKGALGVPPELDIDVKETEYQDVFFEDDDSDDVPEDSGRKAFGHWDDWDAVLDSPIFDRHSPHASRRTSVGPTGTNSSTTPTIVTQLPTPDDVEYFTLSPGGIGPSGSEIFIEPVLAVSDAFAPNAHPPPLSLPASLSGENNSLGDIGEEDEEAAETSVVTETQTDPDPAANHPQVLGLRFSTPAAPMVSDSPSFDLRSATTGAPMRSPSFSSRTPNAPALSRSNSQSSATSNLAASLTRRGSSGSMHMRRSGSFGSSSVRSFGSDAPYNAVAERGPGNPLFPSNFARLAVGPTLAANNPSMRSPTLPPQFKHGIGGVRRSSSTRSISERGNRFRRSWGVGGDDYAITIASGSSAGGSVRDGE